MSSPFDRPTGAQWEAYERTVRLCQVFSANAAPLAFTWLGWCGLLALLRYGALKSGLWPLDAIQWILGLLLWLYFINLFSPGEVEWLSKEQLFSRTNFARIGISLAATAGMVSASYWFAGIFVRFPL